MSGGRRYSNYDEYEGIFGPLGVHGTVGRHHSRRNATTSSRAKTSRHRLASAFTDPHGSLHFRGTATANTLRSSVETRARYLATRRAKRYLEPVEIDDHSNSADDDSDAASPLAPSLPLEQQRQVWLPTRGFAFRQRAGKLDMRALARVDVARIIATTDVDTIQRHVENLAFADVTLDDVEHYSDAYFLKLFQIAQLTLEHLLHVQESLVTHATSVETQCDALLTECQQLERDNSSCASEITALKRDIQHKQRTLATFEVMLLNASVSQRQRLGGRSNPTVLSDKENAAAQANTVVESLLGEKRTIDNEEDGAVTQPPVDCVLCGKTFVSPAFLVRHQQRKHQQQQNSKHKKHKKRSASSSNSSDASSSSRHQDHKASNPPASLPPELLHALDEKNRLAQQLLALEAQLASERVARDAQSKMLAQQQQQLATHVDSNMNKLESLLQAIDAKQDATKQDVVAFTQATLERLQREAANAQTLQRKAAAAARVGALESDDDDDGDSERRDKTKPTAAAPQAPLETVLAVFLHAQAQQQQQQLEHLTNANRKLWRKSERRHQRQQHVQQTDDDDTSGVTLLQMAAMDVKRFGIDYSDASVEEKAEQITTKQPVVVIQHEAKGVQTDDDDDSDAAVTIRQAALPVAVPVPVAIKPPSPVQSSSVVVTQAPPAPEQKTESRPLLPVPQAPPVESKPASPPLSPIATVPAVPDATQRLQHAAHAIGRVARGFLTRRQLANPSNWLVWLPFTALADALSAAELAQLYRQYQPHESLVVKVVVGMTANALRRAIAHGLSSSSSNHAALDDDAAMDDAALAIDYHRVLLHHRTTHVELVGDRLIHALRNQIDVEVVPCVETVTQHVERVCAAHSGATMRLRDLRDAATRVETNDSNRQNELDAVALHRIVRLQTHVRSFLAKRTVVLKRIDLLIDLRLLDMRNAAANSRSLRQADGPGDSAFAQQCRAVRERLAATVARRLGATASSTQLESNEATTQLDALAIEQQARPAVVQTRIQSILTRLPIVLQTAYDATDTVAAASVAIARQRLEMLLCDARIRRNDANAAIVPIQQTPSPVRASVASLSLSLLRGSSSSTLRDFGETLDSMDAAEIARLANAYEDGVELQQSIHAVIEPVAPPVPAVRIASPVVVEPIDVPPSNNQSTSATNEALPTRSATLAVPDDTKPRTVPPTAAIVRRTVVPPPLLTRRLPPSQSSTSTLPTTSRDDSFESFEPGRSPRPTLQAGNSSSSSSRTDVISPFSKTPLLSRRGGGAAGSSNLRRGTGYDNAR